MTNDEDFDELLNRCFETLKTKSTDYAEQGDRLAEFRATSGEMGITMRQTLGVYMNKHLRSVKRWVKGEELKGEPIEEKLLDIIVYCLLGYKMVKEERRRKSPMKYPDPAEIAKQMTQPTRKLKAKWTKEMQEDVNAYTSETCSNDRTDPSIGFCQRVRDHEGPCSVITNEQPTTKAAIAKEVDANTCDGTVGFGDNVKPCARLFDHSGRCMI